MGISSWLGSSTNPSGSSKSRTKAGADCEPNLFWVNRIVESSVESKAVTPGERAWTSRRSRRKRASNMDDILSITVSCNLSSVWISCW